MIYRYKYPELFSKWQHVDFKKYNSHIVLFGAGRRGLVAAHCLKKQGVEFLCFCDNDSKKQGTFVGGHEVISPEELLERYPDAPILITTNHYYYIKEQLTNMGYKEIFSAVSLFLEIDFDGFDSEYSIEYMCRNTDQYFNSLNTYTDENTDYLADIMFNVTTRCTLRCKECSTYIPYVTIPEDFNINKIISSVEKLLLAYKKIGNVSLYGGEPLLYKDLSKLAGFLTSKEQIQMVTIITNGTLLPDEALLTALKSSKIRVRISDYGVLSQKKNQLIDLLKKNHIFFEVTNFQHWDLTPTVDILDETEEEVRQKVLNCCTIAKMPLCINGKMFFCGFSGYYHYLNAVPDFGDNYVDLEKFNGSGEELRNEIMKKFQMANEGRPKKVCSYCKFDHLSQHLPVAEQTDKILKFKKVY